MLDKCDLFEDGLCSTKDGAMGGDRDPNRPCLFSLFHFARILAGMTLLVAAFQPVRAQSTDVSIYSLYISGNKIFAGTDSVVYLSTDNGASWVPASSGLPNLPVNCFAECGGKLFAGSFGNGIFVSTDNGTSWATSNTGLTSCRDVFVFAVLGGNIFAGIDSVAYLSTNNGASWTEVGSGFGPYDIKAMTVIGDKLFTASYGGGIFETADNGNHWTADTAGLRSTAVSSILSSNGFIFAASMGGVYRSSDNGASWAQFINGLGTLYAVTVAAIGNDIFTGTAGYGAYLSTDSGAHWTEANNGLTNKGIRCFAVSGNAIYAGTNGGVFLSTDNGTSWTAANNGIATKTRLPVMRTQTPAGFKIITRNADGSKASIVFSLQRRERVNFTVYDLPGHAVQILSKKQFEPGSQIFFWDTRSLTPGFYTVKMQTETSACAKNFTLIR
jgi:photosystem II stability/assembly factor-like uncharacterized protein